MATKEVTFVAPSGNLRLVLEPRRRIIHEGGIAEVTDGKHVEFTNGRFSTNDSDLIKALRNHPLKDAGSGVSGNFVEEGKEPGRPLPETSDVLTDIVKATADKDGDRLAEIYVAERSSHSRPEVLAAAAAGLEEVGDDVPDPPETPLHEQERVRPEGIAGAKPGVDGVEKPKAKPKAK